MNVVLLLVLSTISLVLLALAAVMLAEDWARSSWDNNLLLANAERVRRLGGTYFTTISGQKGPLWQGMYDVALMITPRRDVWFVIAAMVVSLTALTGAAIAALLRAARLPTWAAVTAGIAAMIFAWFATEEWTYALYSRNIVVVLTTASLALIVSGARLPGYARILVLMAGGLMGLAVQTNQGSALTAVFVLAALWLLGRTPGQGQISARALVGLSGIFVIAFLVTLSSAAVWYVSRGVFDDFWAQWWTHNLDYTEATGRSYLGIVAKGVSDFVSYYGSHWLYGLTILGYLIGYILAFPRLSAWDRRLGSLLIAWWLVEMAAVVLSQRFFGHYLVLPFVPVAVMAGALLGKAASRLEARGVVGPGRPEATFALASSVVLLVLSVNISTVTAAANRAVAFRGLEHAAETRAASLSPSDASLREVVDTWSRPDDYVYAWTDWPYVWEVIRRTPATRYPDKHWLTGQVFGGGASPEWALPNAWQNWVEDLRAERPRLLITFPGEPVPAGSPVERLIACGYVEIYRDDTRTVYRADDDLPDCVYAISREIAAQS